MWGVCNEKLYLHLIKGYHWFHVQLNVKQFRNENGISLGFEEQSEWTSIFDDPFLSYQMSYNWAIYST